MNTENCPGAWPESSLVCPSSDQVEIQSSLWADRPDIGLFQGCPVVLQPYCFPGHCGGATQHTNRLHVYWMHPCSATKISFEEKTLQVKDIQNILIYSDLTSILMGGSSEERRRKEQFHKKCIDFCDPPLSDVAPPPHFPPSPSVPSFRVCMVI